MTVTVAILGATGVVGQKAIALLSRNQRFRIIELVASDQRVGRLYGEVCDWREPLIGMPEEIAAMRLMNAENLQAEFVVSCLPSEVATLLEPKLANQGKIVFSNASAHRMHPHVPLLVPEVNQEHLRLLAMQKTHGKIITNPNCSAVGVALGLMPLRHLAKIQHVSVVTMQSISGAGYPGVASLDIVGNTIPHIEGEAEKIAEETRKILGSTLESARFGVTAHVHRVPVNYGHTITMHVNFDKAITVEQVKDAYRDYESKYPGLVLLHERVGRPQVSKDLKHDDMRVHVGHICQGAQENIIGLVTLTNNLVRGAAGAVIANMESYINFQGGRYV